MDGAGGPKPMKGQVSKSGIPVMGQSTSGQTVAIERAPSPASSLWVAIEEIRRLDDPALIVRRAIELGRDALGLKHARIVVLDPSRALMFGTWGMDLAGAVVDERDLVLDFGGSDLEALRRLEQEGAPFTVFDDGTRWVAKTPIRSMHETIAMLVNDAGTTGAGVDEAKQTSAAILCSTLGELLAPVRRRFMRSAPPGARGPETVVASAVALLERDPGLASKELAASLNVQLSYLRSIFKVLVGMSMTDYRNHLRLDRFQSLLAADPVNMKSAAHQAGFGSYAQFHRVFRSQVRLSPREYLRLSRLRCYDPGRHVDDAPGGRSSGRFVGLYGWQRAAARGAAAAPGGRGSP
jgi:AraC-like DNA-binding protein